MCERNLVCVYVWWRLEEILLKCSFFLSLGEDTSNRGGRNFVAGTWSSRETRKSWMDDMGREWERMINLFCSPSSSCTYSHLILSPFSQVEKLKRPKRRERTLPILRKQSVPPFPSPSSFPDLVIITLKPLSPFFFPDHSVSNEGMSKRKDHAVKKRDMLKHCQWKKLCTDEDKKSLQCPVSLNTKGERRERDGIFVDQSRSSIRDVIHPLPIVQHSRWWKICAGKRDGREGH